MSIPKKTLLVVCPPQALTLANGPPLAPVVLSNSLQCEELDVQFFDANAAFFGLLIDSAAHHKGALKELKRLLSAKLSREMLNSDDLNAICQLFTYIVGEERRPRQQSLNRAGFEWSGILGMLFDGFGDHLTRTFRDLLLRDAYNSLVADILAFAPDAIAFSVLFHTQYESMERIASQLRERGFTGPVIAGGAAIKLCSRPTLEGVLKSGAIDVAYQHSIYGPTNGLTGYLTGRLGRGEVPNGLYAGKNGSVCTGPTHEARPQKLPGPFPYSLIDGDVYLSLKTFPVLVSEGCYWGDCEFCDYPYLAKNDAFLPNVLFRQPSAVAVDIETIVEHFGVNRIDLISDSIPYGYFKKLEREAGATLRHLGVSMECSVRAEPSVDESHFQAIAACGITSITIGVESLNDDVLAAMKKGNTYDDIMRCILLARQHDIEVKANLIVDYPRLKASHVPEMLQRLRELEPHLASVGVHNFSLSPFSPMAMETEWETASYVNDASAVADHGPHHVQIGQRASSSDEALAGFADAVRKLSYRLAQNRENENKHQRSLRLPFRWHGDQAIYSADSGNLVVVTPATDAPYQLCEYEY